MPMTVSELQVKVSADTREAESGLAALGSKIGSTGSMLATAFGGAAIAGIAALGAGVAASVSKFAEFEAQMNILRVTTGASEAQLAAMSERARALGSDMDLPATSSAGAATAMLELAKAGLDVDQTMAAAKGTLQLAAAAGIDEAKAAQLASGALNAFGLDGTKATTVANQLAYAANASALDATDLGQAVAQAGSIFRATGQPMEALLSSMIVLGNAGLSGSDGATAVKNALMQAISPTDKAAATMKQYGISLFDAQGQMKPVSEIVDVLNTRLGPLTEQQRNAALATIFQSDGMKALIPLMAAGGDKLREYESNLKTTNAASEQAEARSAGITGAWKGMVSQIETLGETVGSKFGPVVEGTMRSVAQSIGELTPTLAALAEQGVSALVEGGRQLADAWRTARQAFEGDWLPSDDIPPFVNAVGQASTKLGELSRIVGEAADKAGETGMWDHLYDALGNLNDAAQTVNDRLSDIGAALDRMRGPTDNAASAADVLAAAAKGAASGLNYAAIQVEGFVDALGSAITVGIDYTTGLSRIGTALQQLQRGDLPGAGQSLLEANAAFAAGEAAAAGFQERGLARAIEGAQAMGRVVGVEMAGVATATETNMAAATAAVEAAGPQMAAAAETAASGAVAAVEGQAGPASAAGQSVGDSLGSGMQSGILAWAGRIASAAANLVSSAIGAARVEADARSPSKKTQKLGEDMAEGLEIGLSKSELGEEMKAKIRAFIDATRDYIPVAGQIKRVEEEIARIREDSQTEALFRAKEMITIDSEVLRLKQAQVSLERDLVPLRQDLARATREVTDIERGSLADRTRLIEMDGQRKTLRLQEIELEKQLIGLDSGSKKAKSIQEQIDKLRDASRALDLEGEKTRLTQDVAATAARIKREGLNDQALGQQTVIDRIKDQIEVLGAEQAVFQANEAVIKNATDNEIGYRNRLIAVFTAEGKPLADRITAGKLLLEQLKSEGKISDELYNAVKKVTDQMGAAKGATTGFGSAAATATPQIDAATKKAQEMAAQAQAVAEQAKAATKQVDALSSSLGKLPDWFRPKVGTSFKPDQHANGGTGTADRSGTILPSLPASSTSSGSMQTHRFVIAGPDGRTLAEWHVRGRDMAVDLGLLPR